jgi:hypothetical protein
MFADADGAGFLVACAQPFHKSRVVWQFSLL